MNKADFRAAVFDMDGTLIDSLSIWGRVDEIFLAARGLSVPEDYARAISGLSVLEGAEYTKARFELPESAVQIVGEWNALAEIEYAECIQLKPGAARYLRRLKRAGVKLAVATALPARLYEPCLRRLGIYQLFDVLCSTDDVGGKGKAGGEVFSRVVEKLGMSPEDCIAFDDVFEGVTGAQLAGMRAYCVHDHATISEKTKCAASEVVYDWSEAPMPAGWTLDSARCVIFTAYCMGDVNAAYSFREGDYKIAADGGYHLAKEAGLSCDELIGDFDSMAAPEDDALSIAYYPVEKDDTDTVLCVNRALALGYDDILIVGGMGGRVDHSMANIQTLAYALARGAHVELSDGRVWMTVIRDECIVVPRRRGKLSVFSLSQWSRGVMLEGVHYPLMDATLTSDYPLGVSNEFEADEARITVKDGTLLIIAGAVD